MKENRVIPNKYLPRKLPINATIFHLFLMHFFDAPQWVWATYIVLAIILWIGIISVMYNQKKDESLLFSKATSEHKIIHHDVTEFQKKIADMVEQTLKKASIKSE